MLGASCHEILTRVKAEPQRFPKIDLIFDPKLPVNKPVVVNLPANGIRLQFDGQEQRLRMVEVLDFTKNHITYKPAANEKERDLVRPQSDGDVSSKPSPGPTFRHIYHRFLGPTLPGEYIPNVGGKKGAGVYILSYPGVAFTFPMSASAYSSGKNNVTLMASSGSQVASTMAVFSGDSFAGARPTLWTKVLPSIKEFAPLSKGKDKAQCPDEVSLVKIHGGGNVQLFRRWTDRSSWIKLGQTTEQDLVREFGPPDAIFRRPDQKMAIHKTRTASNSRSRHGSGNHGNNDIHAHLGSLRSQDGVLTDTDQSSAQSASEGYDSNEDAVEDDDEDDDEEDEIANIGNECFYNYFYLGFDVLVSPPTKPSPPAPTQTPELASMPPAFEHWRNDRLVATKVVLHSNVPGSYPFNRHRRCRWEIAYLADKSDEHPVINSETPFDDIEVSLRQEWKDSFPTDEECLTRQKGMVLNRGWGDSPGSSIELLGGWEEGINDRAPGAGGKKFDGSEESTTTLYGFPGLAVEVLRNGFVSALTVF